MNDQTQSRNKFRANDEGDITKEGTSISESNRIRVMTVDDQEILRGGIRFSLLAFDDLELVGEARSGEEALRLCREVQAHVVLMDLRMPNMDGVETTRAIRSLCPQVQVVALSSYYDQNLVRRAMQAGAIGYLVKGVSAEELAEAIRAAHAGRPALGQEAVGVLLQCTDSSPKPGADLSEREREVLALLADGLSNAEIALQLVVSISTVKYHVRGIYSKLGAANRAQAVALALRHHLVSNQT